MTFIFIIFPFSRFAGYKIYFGIPPITLDSLGADAIQNRYRLFRTKISEKNHTRSDLRLKKIKKEKPADKPPVTIYFSFLAAFSAALRSFFAAFLAAFSAAMTSGSTVITPS